MEEARQSNQPMSLVCMMTAGHAQLSVMHMVVQGRRRRSCSDVEGTTERAKSEAESPRKGPIEAKPFSVESETRLIVPAGARSLNFTNIDDLTTPSTSRYHEYSVLNLIPAHIEDLPRQDLQKPSWLTDTPSRSPPSRPGMLCLSHIHHSLNLLTHS